MKFLYDLFPVILFFIAFKLFGIYVATAVAIAATIIQIIWAKLRTGKVEATLIMSGAIIVVFGGATLWLHDESFIKWKPTILYWLFTAGLLGSQWLFGRNLIRKLMEKQIAMPDPVWTRLNLAWAVFFLMLGFLNLYVAFNYSTEIWVDFKLFGTMGLMLVFVIGQSLLLNKHIIEQDKQ
ncbi:intracellular septation protein [Methylobacillus rhizosphaerae]|uniref:Inner membrane-spanning protein YciB n=1 Tax=Methylobacillus rhizosphaerae TaxID=551994 RepID=A0A239AQZ8_9PROT|nr:septation protein A [Methylobacillus rhizosphaerae]SNR97781.1 intracellular septation protein [Methylobacillus rhizosphaerae]